MSTIQIDIPEDVHDALRQRAAAADLSLQDYLLELLAGNVSAGSGSGSHPKSGPAKTPPQSEWVGHS